MPCSGRRPSVSLAWGFSFVLSGPVRLDRSLRIDLRDSPSQARHLGCPGVPWAAQKPGTLRLFRAPDSSPTSAPGGLLATSFFPKFHVRAPASGAAVGTHSPPRIRGAPRCIRGARLVAGRGTSANRVLAALLLCPTHHFFRGQWPVITRRKLHPPGLLENGPHKGLIVLWKIDPSHPQQPPNTSGRQCALLKARLGFKYCFLMVFFSLILQSPEIPKSYARDPQNLCLWTHTVSISGAFI